MSIKNLLLAVLERCSIKNSRYYLKTWYPKLCQIFQSFDLLGIYIWNLGRNLRVSRRIHEEMFIFVKVMGVQSSAKCISSLRNNNAPHPNKLDKNCGTNLKKIWGLQIPPKQIAAFLLEDVSIVMKKINCIGS